MRPFREYGIVSNCWKFQLQSGQLLTGLLSEAVERGFRHVELRQGFLGEFETIAGDAARSADARDLLDELTLRFPELQMNLAISIPCFGDALDDDDPGFREGLAAAIALSRGRAPHLRIVDTQTRTVTLSPETRQRAARRLVQMTRSLIEVGGMLTVEHAYQAWSDFWSVFHAARQQLRDQALQLRCCFDPCNLLITEPVSSVAAIVDSVLPDTASMIHLKQRRDGQILPRLETGDLDWRHLMALLDRHGHRGPWFFEIAPDSDVWQNLEQAKSMVEQFG
jgi:sugar phosphate isomerase/epimerase